MKSDDQREKRKCHKIKCNVLAGNPTSLNMAPKDKGEVFSYNRNKEIITTLGEASRGHCPP